MNRERQGNAGQDVGDQDRAAVSDSAPTTPTQAEITDPVVVGIGASAGGLEAILAFFERAPADTGAAFVVVHHLAPHHESMLAELIQKRTTMPVKQVHDQPLAEANHIYVIPPNKMMGIFGRRLQLSQRVDDSEGRKPIDHFLRTLADDQGDRAVCIILLLGSESARRLAENVIASINEPFLLLDGAMRIFAANAAFLRTFQVLSEETTGRSIYAIGDGQWDVPALRHLLEQIIPNEDTFSDYRVRAHFPRIGDRDFSLHGRRVREQTEGDEPIILSFLDRRSHAREDRRNEA